MSESILTISVEAMKRVQLITAVGRVDSNTAAQLEDALKAGMKHSHNLVLDLSGVTYMSSAGIRALVATLRECKKNYGDVRLANVSSRVAEVLSLAGLDSLFQTFDDTTSAVGSF